MDCHNCNLMAQKYGKDRKGNQRYYCCVCSKSFYAPQEKPLEDRRIPMDTALRIISCLVEGNSISSTQRIVGVHKVTVLSLLELAGERCMRLMDERIKDVKAKFVEADEIWGFVLKKERRKKKEEANNPYIGDAYTFVGIDAVSKLARISHRPGQWT